MTSSLYRGFKLWKFRFSCFAGSVFSVDYIAKYGTWYSFDFLVSGGMICWGVKRDYYDGNYFKLGLGPLFSFVVGPY